jgi:hypothetical protein
MLAEWVATAVQALSCNQPCSRDSLAALFPTFYYAIGIIAQQAPKWYNTLKGQEGF